MNQLPTAGTGHDDAIRQKIDAAVSNRSLSRAANNTKWDELIHHFRKREDWWPSYRYKAVTGFISGWDVEWHYHLPFPFALVEWFDIGLKELEPSKGMLLPRTYIDHTEGISGVVRKIGLEFEVHGDVLRIWGYLPKTYDDFPPV